jgi:glucosamine--fructose-6-phosphate aminotransferase (isomerizing)
LKRLDSGERVPKIVKRFGASEEWVFIGCGSSYYIALAAASSWAAITGTRARALPASELLLFPDLAFLGLKEFTPVLISRSGQTSEVLRVAQLFKDKGISSLAISCASGEKLETMATTSILLPEADEQSTVMTRAFTSMLLALQYVAASLAGDAGFLQDLRRLPAVVERVLPDLPQKVREFVARNSFSDYVCLGQGPYYGLACESALKVMEMSQTYAQSFHTLEFRHGPKSIVNASTLVTLLLSDENHDAEIEVLEEMKDLGGKTLVVAKNITARARAASDLAVDLDSTLPEISCLAPFVLAGQLVGFHHALKKGLDPDRPINLSRVVLLAD